MATYDDQNIKTRPERLEEDDLRNITGISPDEESKMEDSAYSGAAEDIAEKNNLGIDNDSSQSNKQEPIKNSLSNHNKAKGKGALSKKSNQMIAGLVVSGVTALSAVFFVNLPSLVVNHLAEMLKSIGNVQIDYTRKYRRRYLHKIGDMFTMDGRRANKLVSEMQRRGYTPNWDGNQLRGFTGPGGHMSTFGLGTTNTVEDFINTKHPLRTARWKTKQMNAMYSKYNIPRKSVVISSLDADASADRIINKAIAEGILKDDPIATQAAQEGAPVNETEDQANTRKARQDLANEIINDNDTLKPVRQKIMDGIPISELDPDERAILKVGSIFDDEVLGSIDKFTKKGFKGALKNAFSAVAVGAVTDATDKICTVKNTLRAAMFASRVYRARAMMQYASIFISASDQTRLGGVSSASMNELGKRIMGTDDKGQNIGSSPGIQKILTGKFSKTRNDASKTGYSVDGSLTGLPGAVNDGVKNIPGTGEKACALWQNPVVMVGTGVLELGASVLTGGAAKAGAVPIKTALTTALKGMVSKQALKGVAFGVAMELSFEGILFLIKIQAERALTFNYTGQEKGGELGSIITGGMGTLNKQNFAQAGGTPATTQQFAKALDEYHKDSNTEFRQKNFFARMFDYEDNRSMIFKAASIATTSPIISNEPSYLISTSASSILRIPASIFGNAFDILTPKSLAQDSDMVEFDELDINGTKYATDHSGNIELILRDDITSIDPEENIKVLSANSQIESSEPYSPIGEEFKNHIAACVENIDIITELENGDPKDCLAKKQITKRFKAHLAYLDMVDGIDAYLFPEEIASNSSPSDTTNSGTGIIPSDGLPWPLAQTKAEAKSTQGSCINISSQSVCHGGHPYLSHDLFAPQGTQVYAVAKGEVISAKVGGCGHGKNSAFTVSVYDAEQNITYFYQHMDPLTRDVTVGTIVNTGDPIGKVGSNSAACDTPSHLHIDATTGRGRPACSRLSCTASNKAKFIDISKLLYKGYEALQ